MSSAGTSQGQAISDRDHRGRQGRQDGDRHHRVSEQAAGQVLDRHRVSGLAVEQVSGRDHRVSDQAVEQVSGRDHRVSDQVWVRVWGQDGVAAEAFCRAAGEAEVFCHAAGEVEAACSTAPVCSL